MDNTPGSITPPQLKFITDLVAKKDLNGNADYMPTDEQREYLLAGDYSAMSKAQASMAIKSLLKLNDKIVEGHPLNNFDELAQHNAAPVPVAEQPAQSLPAGATSDDEPPQLIGTVNAGEFGIISAPATEHTPVQGLETTDTQVANDTRSTLESELTQLEQRLDAGHYFIVDPTDDTEKFYKVSKPTEGRWAGRTFLEVRASDYFYPVKATPHKVAIYRTILEDALTAMNEYGIRLGVCGCCGRTLTARDSRLRGLGPVCASRILGQPTEAQLDMLDRLGLRKNA